MASRRTKTLYRGPSRRVFDFAQPLLRMNGARRRFAAMNTNRHYGMDWLRIGAFALLIFYHIGMYFVPWGWHVKTPHPMDWVQIPMMATNRWRLPLLFLVSGRS